MREENRLAAACVVSIERALFPVKAVGLDRVTFRTYSIRALRQSRENEGYKMCLVDGPIVLPITDAKMARMKPSVVSSLGVLLAVSVVVPHLTH